MSEIRKALPYGAGFAMSPGELTPWINAAEPVTMAGVDDLRRRKKLLRRTLPCPRIVWLCLRRAAA